MAPYAKPSEKITFPKNLLYGPKLIDNDGNVHRCKLAESYDIPFGQAIITVINEPLPAWELSEGTKDPVPIVIISAYFASLKSMRKATNLAGRAGKKYSAKNFLIRQKPALHNPETYCITNACSMDGIYQNYKLQYERGDIMAALLSNPNFF